MSKNVSDLFVDCLENEGVRFIFGVPGEENEDLLFALDHSAIRFIPTRHEQGAAFMADVWGRLTGEAGVCLSTLGPGATNLLTGIADANSDKSPVVALTAQGGLDRLHHESHQKLDIVSLFRPVTKWNTAVSTPTIIPEVVRKAFKVAEMEKPGATHIELPEDLAGQPAPGFLEPLPAPTVRRPSPDKSSVNRAVELLLAAERPLIIAGNGAIRKRASKQLTRLATRHHIPVAATFMGKGAISDKLDQSLLAIGLGFKDYVMAAVEQADLVLTVGYDIAEYAPQKWNGNGRKPIIHIDFSPAEVYTHYLPSVEIIGDVAAAIREINKALAEKPTTFSSDWYAPVRQRILADIEGYTKNHNQDEGFTIPAVLNQVRRHLADEGLLLSDVGSHKMWIARNFPTYVPNGCLISNGLASMGIALPGGIAAALVDPDRPIVAMMGDGGFMMNVQELETAVRLGVGFTIIVLNDNDYGLISWKQRRSHGRSVSTRINNPDFTQLAQSFGITAYRPTTMTELDQQLQEALTCGQLRLLEIPVNPAVNDALIEKLNNYWQKRRVEQKKE